MISAIQKRHDDEKRIKPVSQYPVLASERNTLRIKRRHSSQIESVDDISEEIYIRLPYSRIHFLLITYVRNCSRLFSKQLKFGCKLVISVDKQINDVIAFWYLENSKLRWVNYEVRSIKVRDDKWDRSLLAASGRVTTGANYQPPLALIYVRSCS